MVPRPRLIPALSALLLAAALALAGGGATASATPAWLCKPGMKTNPCVDNLNAQVVTSGGGRALERTARARDPKVDCFYVYPTVTNGPGDNAAKKAVGAISNVAKTQAARFGSLCRIYAPLYRQLSITAIGKSANGDRGPANLAYGDVAEAWKSYLKNDNKGRGVILIGHSQGSGVLTRLLREEFDPKPANRKLLIAAHLLGGNVTVKKGSDRGGDFKNIPACRRTGQTGCVVAFSTYLNTPPRDTLFGKPGSVLSLAFASAAKQPDPDTLSVICTNPASLTGGKADLHPYFPDEKGGTRSAWVTYPERYSGQCKRSADGTTTYLKVTALGGAQDKRDVVQEGLGAAWGLHLVDVSIALGDLVDVAERQVARYVGGAR